MSDIKIKIHDDIKTAMRARDQVKLTTLRQLSSAIKQVEVDNRKDVDDETVIAILQKEVKKRRDSLQFAEQAKRDDLIAQNKAELELIQSYLGAQLSEDDLRKIISSLISSGTDNLGKIMGELNKEHKGKFEGKLASDLARSLLGQT